MVYQFRDGFTCKVPAPVMGEWLDGVKRDNGGLLRPRDVVAAARPKASPVHACFEWADKVAGEKWREEQARRIIRHVVIVEEAEEPEDEPKVSQAYVSVARNGKDGQGYMDTSEALSSADTREIVISLALASLRGWRRRYGNLEELAHVAADYIEPAIEELEAVEA